MDILVILGHINIDDDDVPRDKEVAAKENEEGIAYKVVRMVSNKRRVTWERREYFHRKRAWVEPLCDRAWRRLQN